MRGNWDETANVPPQQLDADTILRVLVEHGVEFVVVGGFAVALHGFPRATKDLDIVPGQDAENHNRLYEALSNLDAQPVEIGDFRPEELPVRSHVKRSPRAATGHWRRGLAVWTFSSGFRASTASCSSVRAPSRRTFPAQE